jgi:hypothetical protein
VRFPLALLLRDRWHADAIWWSFPLASFVAVLLAMAYYKFGSWKRARMIGPRPGGAPAQQDQRELTGTAP